MGRIIGIDLGTTYCAMAVPGEIQGDSFLVLPECPGYSVILDKNKLRITPAVVAEDKTGKILVGRPAKGRIGFSPAPIMFAKRAMGEDRTFELKTHGRLRPEEVSAEILKYLKTLAEEQLGEAVDEAVITVPAYFSLRAKQMTEKAGELAGLHVVQLAQEPVAAALMYCAGDPRPKLCLMTYDLGGGTFDVAILEKKDGVIGTDSILAFSGDHFLGGYDFDKRLAYWLMDRLVEQNYDLHLDLNNPNDKAIFTKLMVYAERAKMALSKADRYEFMDPMTGITDHSGNEVVFDYLEITRAAYEAMIEDLVDRSIQLSFDTMAKVEPPLKPDDLDEILMVGGSSHIPLVKRKLAEAFGREPKLVEPDLCVALGAAILAGDRKIDHFLDRPLRIVTLNGPLVIAPLHTRLPYQTTIQMRTSDSSGQLSIPLLEGEALFGKMNILDIPITLPIGSLIELAIDIQENYQVSGHAKIPAFALEVEVGIDISIAPVKTLEELRTEYENLTYVADEELRTASKAALFSKGGRIKELMKAVEQMFLDRAPEPAVIQERMNEIRNLVGELAAGWRPEPPWAAFDARVSEAQDLLNEVVNRKLSTKEEGYDRQLEAIQTAASKAYQSLNSADWKDAFNKLAALCERLEKIARTDGGEESAPPHPISLIVSLSQVLEQLRQNAQYMGNYFQFATDFMEAEQALRQIDPNAKDAMSQIRDWYLGKFESLRFRVVEGTSVQGMMRLEGGGGGGMVWPKATGPSGGGGRAWLGRSDPNRSNRQSEPALEAKEAALRRPEVPGAVDKVHFSVTAPPVVAPGSAFVVDVWAHMESQRKKMIQRAREAAAGKEILVKTKGPLPVARGTVLTVNLKMGDLLIEDAQDTILWEGEIGSASFAVQARRDAAPGERAGRATIYAGAAQIGRIDFTLSVGAEPVQAKALAAQETRYQTAFASYASLDRDEVLLCIQGMEKAAPWMNIFVDVHSLRSGQKWEQELWTRIPASDVFFLFWSTNAMQSPWVEKEWRCALSARGLDFIDPLPLQPPEVAPPPQELAGLHFNDWQLAYQRKQRG